MIEQAKFTYSPLGKAFEKQIKTIEDQGEKQVEALKDLKPKEQTKAIEGESSSQSKAKKIFSDLIKERESMINKLYESVDYNNLKFEYVSSTKSVSFYEFMNSKEPFNETKSNQITFNDAQKKQKLFLNKLNDVKMGKKRLSKKKSLPILKNVTNPKKKFSIFLETILKCTLMLVTK